MAHIREGLANAHVWWRVAKRDWANPLDPRFAQERGGRWNPPRSFPALYLNEDQVTARLNLRAFIAEWPYEPEDLRDDNGPILVGCTLPRSQAAADIHTPEGVRAAGLPPTFPYGSDGALIPHALCQPIGARVKAAGLRGVRARSAQSREGAGRELVWFPASARSAAKQVRALDFAAWYWG